MRSLLIALALMAASPAAADVLPLKHGFYARVEKGCDTHGSLAAYSALISYDGRTLNDTSHERRLLGSRHSGSAWDLRLASKDLSEGGAQRLAWLVIVVGAERFHLTGMDRATNWTDDYIYCGKAIP